MPWLTLAFLPVHIALVLFMLGASALGTLVGAPSALTTILSLVQLALGTLSLPGILRRTRQGWAFFTYVRISLTLVTGLTSFSLFGVLISVVTLWLAFQVKQHYT